MTDGVDDLASGDDPLWAEAPFVAAGLSFDDRQDPRTVQRVPIPGDGDHPEHRLLLPAALSPRPALEGHEGGSVGIRESPVVPLDG